MNGNPQCLPLHTPLYTALHAPLHTALHAVANPGFP